MASATRSLPRAFSSCSKTPVTAPWTQLPPFSRASPYHTRQLPLHSIGRCIPLNGRRAYATATEIKPRRRAGFFRWTWRAIYLSSLGATGMFIYHLYDLRHPADQLPQDPSKKNLVILGSGWGAVSLLKKLDTSDFNVTVVSPRNFFLFTPLLPSCTTGTVEHRSIMEPLRNILRHKQAQVNYYEAQATKIDADKKIVYISDSSDIKGDVAESEVPYDHLVIAVGAENATFGIPGVKEHSCFLKEVGDAQAIRRRVMDCIETAVFKDQSQSEIDRLMHMVIVGGGPTGVEFAAELYDWVSEDLKRWVNSPEMERLKITLVEALPSVLPMFSKQLIDYTNKEFQEDKIEVRTRTTVKEVTAKYIKAEITQPDGSKTSETIPYGLLVWATGNAVRPVIKDLMNQLPAQASSRRGLLVDEHLRVKGADGIFAVGDCAITNFAPTAQVASQEGSYLAKHLSALARTATLEAEISELNARRASAPSAETRAAVDAQLARTDRHLRKVKAWTPFEYSHQGSLAYIGKDKAIADISWFDGNFATGGSLTYLFWRSAYLSMCFSTRNRMLVLLDWTKCKVFGRDVSRE